jgi:glycosyltransferase involved in cell wall biosynthesis
VRNQYESLIVDADKIIVTTNSYAKKLSELFPLNKKKVKAVHLTYDGNVDEAYTFNVDAATKFIYAGLLGSGRSLRGFVEGVHLAVLADPNLRELLHVDLIGDGDGFDGIASMVKDLNIENLFQFHGMRDKDYCDKYCAQADVLIVMQSMETSKMQIPGKIFNYLKYLKPVMGLMPDCEAAEILEKSGLGVVHLDSDTNGIAKTLRDLCCKDGSPLANFSPNVDFIKEFSTVALYEKLKTILDDVT